LYIFHDDSFYVITVNNKTYGLTVTVLKRRVSYRTELVVTLVGSNENNRPLILCFAAATHPQTTLCCCFVRRLEQHHRFLVGKVPKVNFLFLGLAITVI
jgi:hypothetical protein